MELSQSPWSEVTDNTTKPKVTSFFPLQKLKGTQPVVKTPAMCLAHLEEDSPKKDKEVESEDPDGIDGVMEEFMVHLVRGHERHPDGREVLLSLKTVWSTSSATAHW